MGLLNSCLNSSVTNQQRDPSILEYNKLLLYQKNYELSPGKFSKVYKYTNINTNKEVVIKFIRNYEMYRTEVKALEKLKHNNIIKLIDYSIIDISSKYYIIEDFASRGDLLNLVTTFEISESLSKYIVKCVLNALTYAYEIYSISHRDVKLENILIMNDGTIKVADWGLASFTSKYRKCNTFCGTISYMAPEILLNLKYKANKSDVWSLGVVLFTLCARTKPYGNCSDLRTLLNDTYYKLLIDKKWNVWWDGHSKKSNIINSFSEELCILIKNVLNVNIHDRYTLSEMLCDRWFDNINYDNNDIVELMNEDTVVI